MCAMRITRHILTGPILTHPEALVWKGSCPAAGSLPKIKLHPPLQAGTCRLPAEPCCLGLPDMASALKGLVLSLSRPGILGLQYLSRGSRFFVLLRPRWTGDSDPVRGWVESCW